MSEQSLFESTYNPDVLSCIANLSNDEVFTPPEIANKMLDMLPQELFKSSETKFLDPACKSGVFLREIAKRLIKGLEPQFPDLQERIDHIFKNQIFGIAITELTSLLSRRSVYCSKYPNCKYSVCQFDENDAQGNIYFSNIKHLWINGKCLHCGASQKEYSEEKRENLESHAYQFIHKEGLGKLENMKFDVIIGNPPYQMNDGGAQASAKPIYHLFVQQAKKLNPRYMSFIIPARWYAGGKGLDSFRNKMLQDNHIVELHDFVDANDCFSGVEIKGGVCYFLWDREFKGECFVKSHSKDKIVSESKRKLLENKSDTFIRYNEAIPILHKVQSFNEKTFDTIVSARKPFGLATNFTDFTSEKTEKNSIYIFANQKQGYIKKNKIEKNLDWIDKWKLIIPKAIGSGKMNEYRLKPLISAPNSVCTETYILIGPFENEKILNNVLVYINSNFFHFMLGLKKYTQDTTSKVYQFVPIQDFSKPWTDEELYAKYNLTQEEIDFIESMIRPMS